MKKLLLLVIAISLSVIITACGDDNDSKETQEDIKEQTVEVTDDELVGEDEIVLTVNGVDIKGEKYNSYYYQTKQRMYQSGKDINNVESVKEQTYNQLIAQELIRQDAIESGIEISEDEAKNELESVKSENEEVFETYLEQFNLTEDAFKEEIKFNLLVNKYIDDVINAEEVTEEEIKELYDGLKEQNEDIMEYDDAKAVIKQQLAQQKLFTKVEELKETADIEKML